MGCKILAKKGLHWSLQVEYCEREGFVGTATQEPSIERQGDSSPDPAKPHDVSSHAGTSQPSCFSSRIAQGSRRSTSLFRQPPTLGLSSGVEDSSRVCSKEACALTYTYIHACMYVCIRLFVYNYTCTYMYINLHTYLHVHMLYVAMYTYVSI